MNQQKMNKVRFTTTQFEFAHGRAPRGKGNWGFDFMDNWGQVEVTKFWFGAFTECRKAAREFANENGFELVAVAS